MSFCKICPRKCLVNRDKTLGFCRASNKIEIAKFYLHPYEEPSINGKYGSGTIFFSHCNLRCIYCQNDEISNKGKGIEITIDELVNIMLYLQSKNATNINLVTPTHYINQIKEAIIKAKNKGLNIPIVYNTSGYEDKNSIRKLDGLVDIYLTDFKYYDNRYAKMYSNVSNYKEVVKEALKEMYKQVGKNVFKDDIMIKGIIVRHLILPGLKEDSKKIIKYVHDTYKDNVYISIMNQYTPVNKIKEYPILNRKITKREYDEVLEYAINIGIENAYIQEDDTAQKSFIPKFNLEDIKKDINQSKLNI